MSNIIYVYVFRPSNLLWPMRITTFVSQKRRRKIGKKRRLASYKAFTLDIRGCCSHPISYQHSRLVSFNRDHNLFLHHVVISSSTHLANPLIRSDFQCEGHTVVVEIKLVALNLAVHMTSRIKIAQNYSNEQPLTFIEGLTKQSHRKVHLVAVLEPSRVSHSFLLQMKLPTYHQINQIFKPMWTRRTPGMEI